MAAPADPPTPSRRTQRPSEPTAVTLTIAGRPGVADADALGEAVRAALEPSDSDEVLCDVDALVAPDLADLEVLARLQLTARRLGGRLLLLRASCDLRDLLRLTGLEAALPTCGGAGAPPSPNVPPRSPDPPRSPVPPTPRVSDPPHPRRREAGSEGS